MRPYGILSRGLRTHGDHDARGSSKRGGFCSWSRPELRTKRIRGSILLPGRISSKGPASMRDASDLQHLVLRCCPRFTSGSSGPSTYRFLHHCDPSTRRLMCPPSLLFFFFFFSLSTQFSPTSAMSYALRVCSRRRRSAFCCDDRYIRKGCQNS